MIGEIREPLVRKAFFARLQFVLQSAVEYQFRQLERTRAAGRENA